MKRTSSKLIVFLSFLFGILLLQSCGGGNPFPNINPFYPKAAPPPYNQAHAVSDTTLDGGTQIYVIKKGSGPFKVTPRDAIQVKLTGRTANGKVFKTSYTPVGKGSNTTILSNLSPNPITYLGRPVSPLIKGLRRGLTGMRKGEKRIIKVPPSMGYVSSGGEVHGINVYNKTLIYNVQLVEIGQ